MGDPNKFYTYFIWFILKTFLQWCEQNSTKHLFLCIYTDDVYHIKPETNSLYVYRYLANKLILIILFHIYFQSWLPCIFLRMKLSSTRLKMFPALDTMPLACWSMKTLTACRTACRTLWSVYWAGGDTGQPRMSASDLFSPQLLSVSASCLKQTIFVSQCNYHHLVILTMLTASAFTKPLNVNAVLVWLLLQLSSSSCPSRVSNLIKWRWWGGKTLFSINFILNLTGGFYINSKSPCTLITSSTFPYWLLSDRHPFTWSHASKLLFGFVVCVCVCKVDY